MPAKRYVFLDLGVDDLTVVIPAETGVVYQQQYGGTVRRGTDERRRSLACARQVRQHGAEFTGPRLARPAIAPYGRNTGTKWRAVQETLNLHPPMKSHFHGDLGGRETGGHKR
jgi:hypothetical protein